MEYAPKRLRARVDSQGRILIPAEYRRELGLRAGEPVSLEIVDDELRVLTIRESIRRAQEIVRKYVPEGVSLADELIAERRAEAAREMAEIEGAPRDD